MLSIDLIRRNPDLVREGLARRSEDSATIDLILETDEAWRQLVYQVDELRKQIKEEKTIPEDMKATFFAFLDKSSKSQAKKLDKIDKKIESL